MESTQKSPPGIIFIRVPMALNYKQVIIIALVGFWVGKNYLKPSANQNNGGSPDSAPFGSGKMFDKFAEYYDIGNWFMSLGQDQKWRYAMLEEAQIGKSDDLLDLATGSADVAIAARSTFKARSVIGLDPSVEMLRVGRDKIAQDNITGVKLVEGDAQSMPEFTDGSFSKITMSFGIRNVPDRLKALKEMRRVIRSDPLSRLAIMEFSAPTGGSFMGAVAKYFVRHVVPIVGGLVTNAVDEYQYLEESIFKFPSPSEFEALIESAGFEMVKRTSFMADVVNIYIARPRL
jgi:demethylmenaquinone methyltransferase / 2-methoxy-6-polyprenyl-1,4-benzoquinol methylase